MSCFVDQGLYHREKGSGELDFVGEQGKGQLLDSGGIVFVGDVEDGVSTKVSEQGLSEAQKIILVYVTLMAKA